MKHLLLAMALLLGAAASHAASDDDNPLTPDNSGKDGKLVLGDSISLGNGRIHTFQSIAKDGKPIALGIVFPRSTLTNLPTEENDGLNCWDSNGDNHIDLHEECSGGHNRVLFFDKNPTPFKWISIDWEPHGHVPADTYGAQHFDFHFYMMPFVERNLIAVGPCNPGTINCAQYQTAIKPVPTNYIHPDFFNTNLAFSRMGNHWADRTSPEFNGYPFTNTFILGSYDGRITFYEPMVSLAYLKSKPNDCKPIKQPLYFETAGYYPTSYCVRHHKSSDSYTVSLEGFVKRLAN